MKRVPRTVRTGLITVFLSVGLVSLWHSDPVQALINKSQGNAPAANSGHVLRQPAAVTNGLIRWWKLDGNAIDSSKNNVGGTFVNAPTLTEGKFGQAYSFASNTYINVGNASDLQFTTGTDSFTLSAWFKKNNDRVLNEVVYKQGSSGQLGYGLVDNAGAGRMMFQLGKNGVGTVNATSSAAISNGVWHHAVGVYNAGTNGMTLYIDGVVAGTNTFNLGTLTSDRNMYIGADSESPTTRWFDGAVDDVRVYNRNLSATEVATLYQGSKPISCDQTCVGYWKLDETSGTVAADGSGRGNSGTYTNGPVVNSEGVFGGGTKFDGVNDFIAINGTDLLPTFQNHSFSVSLWVNYSNDTNADNPLFSIGAAGNTNGLLHFVRRNMRMLLDFYGDSLSSSGQIISGNQWWHIAATWDSATWRQTIYVNGKQDATRISNAPLMQQAGDFAPRIGRYSNSSYCACSIDDFRIYNRALSASEISDLYLSGR